MSSLLTSPYRPWWRLDFILNVWKAFDGFKVRKETWRYCDLPFERMTSHCVEKTGLKGHR